MKPEEIKVGGRYLVNLGISTAIVRVTRGEMLYKFAVKIERTGDEFEMHPRSFLNAIPEGQKAKVA